MSLGDAARLADADRWTMRDILHEHGVEIRPGSLTKKTQPTRKRQQANSNSIMRTRTTRSHLRNDRR
nr:hypothetical protein [Haloquadratum walsbyi]